MKCTFENFKSLNLDTSSIALESTEYLYPYWCYPLNSKPIGLEGCILYCFIDGYDEMVFAANPESCADSNVYPLAKNFEDFLRLIVTCGSANPVEQIVWMSEQKFKEHLAAEMKVQPDTQKEVLNKLKTTFKLTEIDNPYEYVKEVQHNFDDSRVKYSDEYYDIKGIEKAYNKRL